MGIRIFDSTFAALIIGFLLDLLLGDPRGLPHPVVLIGALIDKLRELSLKVFPNTPKGERLAGLFIWIITAVFSYCIPALLIYLVMRVGYWYGLVLESLMCWQCIAARSLKTESMKVYDELQKGDLDGARKALSMIVGRDTEVLDEKGVVKAAVETVAENTSDGIVAPMLYFAIGGAPLAFLYKAVNTMDSMLGYIDPPFTNLGFFPAKIDDIFNFIPARISALLMLLAGALQKLDVKNGWRIFRRDRYKHASPNSAQTESMCAGLLDIQLAGDAVYKGVLHKKEFIGDPIREIEKEDIPRANRLMYMTVFLSLLLCLAMRFLIISQNHWFC